MWQQRQQQLEHQPQQQPQYIYQQQHQQQHQQQQHQLQLHAQQVQQQQQLQCLQSHYQQQQQQHVQQHVQQQQQFHIEPTTTSTNAILQTHQQQSSYNTTVPSPALTPIVFQQPLQQHPIQIQTNPLFQLQQPSIIQGAQSNQLLLQQQQPQQHCQFQVQQQQQQQQQPSSPFFVVTPPTTAGTTILSPLILLQQQQQQQLPLFTQHHQPQPQQQIHHPTTVLTNSCNFNTVEHKNNTAIATAAIVSNVSANAETSVPVITNGTTGLTTDGNGNNKKWYTVQDRPKHIIPIYNGINIHYPNVQCINDTPPIYIIPNFLSPIECEYLIDMSENNLKPAPVVGAGDGQISMSRTSSTCYISREEVPWLLQRISLVTNNKPINHCELPQIGQYKPGQQYLQHYDAFDLSTNDGIRFALNGGQRIITILLYLNTIPYPGGGSTKFPNILVPSNYMSTILNTITGSTTTTVPVAPGSSSGSSLVPLEVQPTQGMALVFFPSTIDGYLDETVLHSALPAPANYTKYVSQIWIRQSIHTSTPSFKVPISLETYIQQKQIQQQQLHIHQQQIQHQQLLPTTAAQAVVPATTTTIPPLLSSFVSQPVTLNHNSNIVGSSSSIVHPLQPHVSVPTAAAATTSMIGPLSSFAPTNASSRGSSMIYGDSNNNNGNDDDFLPMSL